MKVLPIVSIFLLVNYSGSAVSQSEYDDTQTIRTIRRSVSSTYPGQGLEISVALDLPKIKRITPRAKITFRQLRDKVRIEFDGSGIGKGTYSIVSSANCDDVKSKKPLTLKKYKTVGSELYRFFTEFGEISTEQSVKEISLIPENEGYIGEKAITFFKITKTKALPLDCKTQINKSSSDRSPQNLVSGSQTRATEGGALNPSS